MKIKVDKLGIGKLETTPVDLSNLSNLVKNDVVKKSEYNELVKRVNNVSTTDTNDLENWLKRKKLVKLKIKLLLIMINRLVLLLKNLIS